MPKLLIVGGAGFVGSTIKCSLDSAGFETVILEWGEAFEERHKADAAIICVSTPNENGRCDDINVTSSIATIHDNLGLIPIMIKSTILPTQVRALTKNITVSPEFLRASNPTLDFSTQEYMLLGGVRPNSDYWAWIFRYLGTEFIYTTPESASWCKYIHNVFLASKVTMFHELDRVAVEMGCKDAFDDALQITKTHNKNVGSSHMDAPNANGLYGYAGVCFPKDMEAFASMSQSDLIKAIIDYNERLRDDHRPKY